MCVYNYFFLHIFFFNYDFNGSIRPHYTLNMKCNLHNFFCNCLWLYICGYMCINVFSCTYICIKLFLTFFFLNFCINSSIPPHVILHMKLISKISSMVPFHPMFTYMIFRMIFLPSFSFFYFFIRFTYDQLCI